MPSIFVTSDSHFNHENILKFTDGKTGKKIRDFSDVTEMNEIMIQRWNSVVSPQDKIYHLGDVFFGSEESANAILKALNGHKRLVVGNHDNLKSKVLHMNFEKISMWRKLDNFLMTHVPVHPSTLGENRFTGRQMINIHGHVHQNPSPDGPYKCVCVDHPGINYYPVALEELKNG